MPFGWAAAAAAVGTIAASAISADAAGSAADKQANAAKDANSTQLYMYNTTRDDQAPWRQTGGAAVNALGQWYGIGGTSQQGTGSSAQVRPGNAPDLTKLPGYQFQFQQGQTAVERNLAARGLLNSGAAGKALEQYGQGVASDYSTQYVNGLQSLAGLGQTSAQATGAAGANAANQIGANQIYAGNAAASGAVGQANAINSGLSGLVGLYGQYSANRNQNTYGNVTPYTPDLPSYLSYPSDTSTGTTTYYGGP